MAKKPEGSTSLAQQELDKASQQFDAFDDQIKSMTMDRMNTAPLQETEQQTKIAKSDIEKSNDVYLKPFKSIGSREKFNENYREEYNHAVEYVQFIAENKEIIGETIELWTKPFAGMPAEFWKVPVNKPLWGPRHLAERIKASRYHRLVMQQTTQGSDGFGQYYGSMAVDTAVQRLDAIPVDTKRKSIFMGSKVF